MPGPDLRNDEISVQGEYYRCDDCGFDSRDADLFDISTGGYATVCAFGHGCHTDTPGSVFYGSRYWAVITERTLPERDPDEGHDDAVDAALERGEA